MSSIPSLVPRDRYAALERFTYFNQASLGLIPAPSIDAMETFLRETAQFGNLYLSDDQEAAILESVRSAGAEALGTSSDAVAVVSGASEGLGQVRSLLEPEHGTVLLVETEKAQVELPSPFAGVVSPSEPARCATGKERRASSMSAARVQSPAGRVR